MISYSFFVHDPIKPLFDKTSAGGLGMLGSLAFALAGALLLVVDIEQSFDRIRYALSPKATGHSSRN